MDGVAYGIYMIQEHNRWDDILQQLRGRVTFEIFTPFGTKRVIVPISAADVLAYAEAILAWANQVGGANSIPFQNGLPPASMTYTPTNTGNSVIIPNLADQSDLGAEVPPYDYLPLVDPIP